MDELRVQIVRSQEDVARKRRRYRVAMRLVEDARIRRDEAMEWMRRRKAGANAKAGGDRVGTGEGVLTMIARLEPFSLRYIRAIEHERDTARQLVSAEEYLVQAECDLASAQSSLGTRTQADVMIADSPFKQYPTGPHLSAAMSKAQRLPSVSPMSPSEGKVGSDLASDQSESSFGASVGAVEGKR